MFKSGVWLHNTSFPRTLSPHQTITMPSVFPAWEDCVYTSQYCEENIWQLCHHVKKNSPEELKYCSAVFISNKKKQIPLWEQKSSRREDGLVVWDYHVICLYGREGKATQVYDLDTKLPFPCPLDKYFQLAIRNDAQIPPDQRRLFRVVPGEVYLNTFASDRSHMMEPDGTWLAPPPAYPCIHTPCSKNNLEDFVSMEVEEGEGSVLTAPQLLQKY